MATKTRKIRTPKRPGTKRQHKPRVYKQHSSHRTKREAQAQARRLRRMGKFAQVSRARSAIGKAVWNVHVAM